MAKLNQIVAVVNGKKTECQKALTELHRKSSKPELFNGLYRKYQPLDEEDTELLPDEKKEVVMTTDQALESCEEILTELFDVIATQDYNNGRATSNVVVDNEVILRDVPVTYLLFLEKQLNDVSKFISSLPTLDVGEVWSKDENQGLYVTQPVETNRTKKTLRHKVLYEATKEHPAQVEKWTEDVTVGKWKLTKFSGAMPAPLQKGLLEKVKKLQDAVKFARENANSIEVEDVRVGKQVFNYLFQ